MAKNPSQQIAIWARKYAAKLAGQFGVTAETLAAELQLEVLQLFTDISFKDSSEKIELTEFEHVLLKHKNKDAFVTTCVQRLNISVEKAEALYNRARKKFHD